MSAWASPTAYRARKDRWREDPVFPTKEHAWVRLALKPPLPAPAPRELLAAEAAERSGSASPASSSSPAVADVDVTFEHGRNAVRQLLTDTSVTSRDKIERMSALFAAGIDLEATSKDGRESLLPLLTNP